jgi:hypothetical protein
MKHNDRNILLLQIQAVAVKLAHAGQQVDEHGEYFITLRQLEELLVAERDLT